jgi:uncharacterized membrane protein
MLLLLLLLLQMLLLLPLPLLLLLLVVYALRATTASAVKCVKAIAAARRAVAPSTGYILVYVLDHFYPRSSKTGKHHP